MKDPVRVTITGAAGQIGYALFFEWHQVPCWVMTSPLFAATGDHSGWVR